MIGRRAIRDRDIDEAGMRQDVGAETAGQLSALSLEHFLLGY
jgi:hypothetical protein